MSYQKTYRNAVDHLNSLQSNAATLEAVRASGGRLSEFAIPEMLEYLERIGYTVCPSTYITTSVLTSPYLVSLTISIN
jgi:hypothetical protein